MVLVLLGARMDYGEIDVKVPALQIATIWVVLSLMVIVLMGARVDTLGQTVHLHA